MLKVLENGNWYTKHKLLFIMKSSGNSFSKVLNVWWIKFTEVKCSFSFHFPHKHLEILTNTKAGIFSLIWKTITPWFPVELKLV